MLVSRWMPTDLQSISIDDQSTIVNTTEKNNQSKCNICNRKFLNERVAKIYKSCHYEDPTINDAVDKGFYSCNDRCCKTCQVPTFGKACDSSSTNKNYDINESINCKTKNVCCLVTCKGCADQ